MTRLAQTLEEIVGCPVLRLSPLSGGCISDVVCVDFENGEKLVAKTGDQESGLALEGFMLRYLKENNALPVPDVVYAEDGLLLISYIETSGRIDNNVQRHGGELLSALHGITSDRFGFETNTLIGGLDQPNSWSESWVDFFRDHRLMYMAREAHDAGRLPKKTLARIEALSARLARWLPEKSVPSLLHGDMWTGNVLCHNGYIAGFVDPAIYFGDAEIELAFSTLFGTFSKPFFERYQELRPIENGFFEERLELYNLYPLLVHVRLFGGSYVSSVEQTLKRFGC
jgi:fructosamine-3-kinase